MKTTLELVNRIFYFDQKAEAELAYELQAAKTKQRIKEENMQIKVRLGLARLVDENWQG